QKPVRPEDLDALLRKVLMGKFAAPEQATGPSRAKSKKIRPKWVVGETEAMSNVLRLIERVAPTDSTILIQGESGTGKELVAQEIHNRSSRRSGPMIPVNCGAIPDNLLESELFGHVKGAFTGAYRSRTGRFMLADKGTIFLDEVGELPPSLQVKLLRVLQTKEIQPLGASQSQVSDFRVVAATNQDLEKAVENNHFREDLYYRLCVIPVELPPLRERKIDIPLLITQFIHEFNRIKNCNVTGLSKHALDALMNYNWPGNIRELKNIIERMVILKGEGEIGLLEIPSKIRKGDTSADDKPWPKLPAHGLDFKQIVSQLEKDLLLQALERTGGNKQKAADLLGLNRTTLVEKIKKKKLFRENG
ncbi:MAG: sigma-54-dependent Fis family transcriptional regulator, partial [Deltaproteobacteria bacterium]|nr:sigma-54-dependent Fis family transcriptional regulator [Deltaproteobacteria bacterium]